MEERPILDVAQVVELERRIAEAGTPLSELMERAGAAVAGAAKQLVDEAIAQKLKPLEAAAHDACLPLPELGPPSIAVLCGSGNNGGDGWVAARILAQEGYRVAVMSPCRAEEVKAQPAHDAAVEAKRVLEEAESCRVCENAGILEFLAFVGGADVVVDAMLGTGFTGTEVREPYDWWIWFANKRRAKHAKVLAADVPSGLSAQTGAAADPCIKADLTVTMIVNKTGLASPEAARWCGEVRVAPLAPIEGLLEGLSGAGD